ncbi:signal transduction histidine kinase [Larkinella arboricola]|uniref:histidine kinase n=2 Tax=Larkinella arboricola TaxID=643671 RepID=A0A327WKA5_LARAB|nr:signal transduction histidine kinase [Larkinella arboricola]
MTLGFSRLGRLIILIVLSHGELQAQQFMLPPPSRQVNKLAFSVFDREPTDEQRFMVWASGHGTSLSYDGHRFRDYDANKTERYRLFHPHSRSPIWITRQQSGKPRQLLYANPVAQRITPLPDTSQLVRQYLRAQGVDELYLGRHGKLWLRLSDQRLLKVDPRTHTVEQVLRPGAFYVLEEAPDGSLWFSTSTGLSVLDPKTGQRREYAYDPAKTAHIGGGIVITAIRVRDNGDVLLGMINEIQILTPRTGRIRKISLPLPTAASQLWTNTFVPDRYGNDYFSVGLMVCRITPQGQLERIDFAHPAEKIIAVYIAPTQDGTSDQLWVRVVSNRLDRYELKRLRPNPSFNLLDVIVNGTRLIENEEVQEKRYQRDSTGQPTIRIQEGDFVQLRFTPFADSRRSIFRYKLEGFSPQWTTYNDWVGVATYQPGAGTYHFLLDWETPTGWQKKPASLRIEVQPIIWKTVWFRVAVLTIIAGVVYWLMRNMYRRRQLRQELARREFEAATLRRMDEIKSQFFANITHEFRTPLTIILNATEQLADEWPTSGRATDRLGAIRYNSHQLLRLINETLDLAKLDAGKLDRHERLGEPIAFIRQVVNQFEGLAQQKHIQLTWNGSPDAELYLFDQDKLETIVYNLLSNAVKFTPSGGCVGVACLVTNAPGLVIRVSDTGIGIPDRELEQIFDRFHQVDSSSTRAYSGTGIGLALVKELTTWLGGEVRVESSVGKGSLFTVTIPLCRYGSTEPVVQADQADLTHVFDSPQKHEPPKTPVLATNGIAWQNDNRPLMLVVEDNAELRQYVVDSLAGSYRTLVAENGRLGLEKAQEQIPDLIISDVMMPEMDGYALVERLKADVCTSHIPILLLTAKSSFESRMKGLEVGADDYMGKPFNVAELALRVKNCLRTRTNWQRWLTSQRAYGEVSSEERSLLEKEDQFLSRLRQAILIHLEDQTLDVDWLAAQANLSRTQLNRKLNALTGMSPNRFIHRVRLEQAANL